MEPAEKADETGPPRDIAGELEGALDAFAAGLGEEAHHRLAKGVEFGDPLAEADLALVPVVRADVEKLLGGILDRLHHSGMGVARGADRDPRSKIEEAVAIDVPDLGAAAARHHEGIVARVGRRHDLGVPLQDRERSRAGKLGCDVLGFHDSTLSLTSFEVGRTPLRRRRPAERSVESSPHSTTVWDCSRRYSGR